jgi:hypothetical protein
MECVIETKASTILLIPKQLIWRGSRTHYH